jgi:transcriptional regulator with XRE-family HTH domain
MHEQLHRMLVDARKKAGLTQVDLAIRLSRPQSYESKVEPSERRLDVIEFFEVAEAIGFEPLSFLKSLREIS